MSLSVHIQKKLGSIETHVDFETASDPLGLLGASGSGKSVTLNCIAGIMKPDFGRIELNGRVLFDSEKHINLPPQKRNIGYLFQEYALFPNMTVLENIQAGVRAGTRRQKREAALEALERFHLQDVQNQYPGTLSGGQKQRTALARIMVGNPELLLLDEPFSALDSYLKWQLLWEMSEYLKPFSGDVLFVSHDRDELSKLCSSVCILDHGKSETVQAFQEFLLHPVTLAGAKLAGYRNISEGTVHNGVFHSDSWGISVPCTDPQAKAICLSNDHLHSLRNGDTDIAIECSVICRLAEGDKDVILLHPKHDVQDTILCMNVSKETFFANNQLSVYFAPADAIILTSVSKTGE